ncbi:MAG: hypothetical protein V1736_03950 [Pseudomonadota bacterium]
MYLCDDGHTEVCYDAGKCPVCDKIRELSDLEDKIFELTEEIKEIKNDAK